MKYKKQIKAMILVLMCSFSFGWYVAAEEITETKEKITEAMEPKGSQEKNKEEEIQKEYEVRIREPDGENGYYVTAPKMTLWASGRQEIFYRMKKADGTVESGKLEKNNEKDKEEMKPEEETKEDGEEPQEPEEMEKNWMSENFQDGVTILTVWQETADEEGKMQRIYEEQRVISVDTNEPSIWLENEKDLKGWLSFAPIIIARAEDVTSGMAVIEGYREKENRVSGKDRISFKVDVTSVNGQAVQVQIYAKDVAGNQSSLVKDLYIDMNRPKIFLKGIANFAIVNTDVEIWGEIEEENIVREYVFEGILRTADGKENFISTLKCGQEKNLFSDNGLYQLWLKARDAAGNYSETQCIFLIDKEKPKIRYVEELEGRYLKEFCWKYEKEHVIQDHTFCSEELLLDGSTYVKGERILKEGRHRFMIRAKDAAGNIEEKSAAFVIDHTAPEIIIKGAKDGETYEKELSFSVALKDPEDFLDVVYVNEKEQRLEDSKRKYYYNTSKSGEYRVFAAAEDKAGNRSESLLHFWITEEKRTVEEHRNISENQIQVKPVKKIVKREEERKKEEKKKEEKKEEKKYYRREKKVHAEIVVVAVFVMLVTVSAIGIKKFCTKREDAG